jgi:hypothetical protein
MRFGSKLCVVCVFFSAQTLSAQSQPGLSFEVYTRNGQGDTATNVVHMLATANAVRMEFEKRPTSGQFRALPLGDHGVLILRGGGAEFIVLDPAKKEYVSIKPLEMMEGARKMMESMGGSMTFDSAASTFQVDSLGPGPTIDGHNTLRYRLVGHTKIHVVMMGRDQTVESQVVSETQNAVDLAEYATLMGASGGARELVRSMSTTIGLPKNFVDQASAAARKARGFPLHSERQTTAITPNGTLTRSDTSDVKNVRRASIPDSTFAVPADYKQTSFPGLESPRLSP